MDENAEKEYLVSFFKQDTAEAGEDEANGNQTVVARITTYKDSPVITLESLGLGLTFKIPQSGLDAIRNAQ